MFRGPFVTPAIPPENGQGSAGGVLAPGWTRRYRVRIYFRLSDFAGSSAGVSGRSDSGTRFHPCFIVHELANS